MGLTRAFQFAGARSIVASLWPISDATTAVFMQHFYAHLKAGLMWPGAPAPGFGKFFLKPGAGAGRVRIRATVSKFVTWAGNGVLNRCVFGAYFFLQLL